MQLLKTLVTPFASILFLRRGPEDLPTSYYLLAAVLVVHFAVYVAAMLILGEAPLRVLALPVLDTVGQTGLFALLLMVMRQRARIVQTLTAVFGTDVLLNGLSLPLLLFIRDAATSPLAVPAMVISLGILMWSLGVKGFILQRAVGVPYYVGVGVAMLFFLAVYTLDKLMVQGA